MVFAWVPGVRSVWAGGVIRATYTRHDIGQAVDLEIPLAPGEDYVAGLARVAPIIRDAMGIKPAKPMEPGQWNALRDRVRKGAA